MISRSPDQANSIIKEKHDAEREKKLEAHIAAIHITEQETLDENSDACHQPEVPQTRHLQRTLGAPGPPAQPRVGPEST